MKNYKNQEAILAKLGIAELNAMQIAALDTIEKNDETILLSPTGTGKTLAFLLPVFAHLGQNKYAIQALILVPTRELAIQIDQVAKDMGSGFRIGTVYGGKSGTKERQELKQTPDVLIGTPGRIADHFRRNAFVIENLKFLVFDEFDKSLEIGFETEMREIMLALPAIEKKVLTSATQSIQVPSFVNLTNPKTVNFLAVKEHDKLEIQVLKTSEQQKLTDFYQLLCSTSPGNGIVFCNFKETINEISEFLRHKNVEHDCFFGGMEQIDRERVLIKFRNGTNRILIATDLAARGLDISELDFIIHFELPQRLDEFTHRNGRTARMHSNGSAYILQDRNSLPAYVEEYTDVVLSSNKKMEKSLWATLFISGGRKDKISKGDIAGLLFKQANLEKNEVGTIELKTDCAFVAVPRAKANTLVSALNNQKLKTKKVRISILS